MNNIDKILQKIRTDCDEKVTAIRSQTNAECAALTEDCANRIKDMRTKNAAKCEKEHSVILGRAESSAQMRRREIMLGARVGLLDKAYADAEKFICTMDREAYSALLARLLASALADRIAEDAALAECGEQVAQGAFEVAFNETDRATLAEGIIADALDIVKEKSGTAVDVSLASDSVKIGGGFILRSGDVSCDCSVHTLIETSRASTEAEAAQVLFQ